MPGVRSGPRVVVVGGSLGGLTAALVLADAGCDVRVDERSASALHQLGAGIVLHPVTERYLTERGALDVAAVSTSVGSLRYLRRDGTVEWEQEGARAYPEAGGFRFTAWNTLFRALRGCLPEGRYHLGRPLTGFDQDADGVTARFADGGTARCELLVCADGVASTARRLLLPGVEPVYAGYVGWRGTLPEAALSPAAARALADAIVYSVVEDATGGGHILVYPIPAPDGAVTPGRRLLNFVWYRNVPAGAPLRQLMTGRDGEHRPVSLPAGLVEASHVRALRADAAALLPAPLAEVVTGTADPFVQAIVDVEVPRMAFGRVCLLGDAAFTARPHAAAGTAKACADAWALADAIRACGGDVQAALRRWEPTQLALGRRLLARVRAMGDRSQVHHTWRAGDPSLSFGLYQPPPDDPDKPAP